MKLRIGACALVLALAGCSGESPESGVAGMRGVAASGASGALRSPLPKVRATGESIANAPDRGQLISYANKGKPSKREGAYTWYPVAISEAHAFRGAVSGEMTVPTPGGGQVKVRYERHAEEIDGNWTWIGRVVGGDPLQEAIITFGEKAVFGSIPMGKGKLPLSLQTRQGQVFAVETDPSLVVSANTGHVDMLVPEASHLRAMAGATASQSAAVGQGAVAVAQNAPQTSANTIDVAIGYTPEFAADNGGASGAATRLVYLIQVGNQAFTNSQIDGYLRIVNAVQVSYTNSTANSTALNEVTGSNGSAQVAVPASLAPLRTARDQFGADIAVLVRKFTTPENAGCGVAWLNGAGGQTGVRASDAPFGYAVISDGYDQGTDGKTYYCADETLVHEAGHLMGAAHDRANSKINPNNPPGGTNLLYGAYTYSFGLNTDAANGNFFTLDAYGDEAGGDTPYRVFSNPNVTICGGRACGVANSEDNARTLNQTIPVVAAFRATVVPFAPAAVLPGQIRGANDRCLDVVGGATGNGSLVQMWSCNGFRQQEWVFNNATAGFANSGLTRVMDVVGFGVSNGSRIQIYENLGGANQAWKFSNAEIVSVGGRVLDAVGVSSANGTKIQLYDSLRGTNQRWTFDSRNGRIVGIGGKCLDVEGASTANGAAVQLWECSGATNQRWSIGAGGRLIGLGGKCLDAVGGGAGNGTRLQMWECNGNPQQSWALRGEIRSALSDKCLDDAGGGNGNGSVVMLFDCHGGNNQRWTYMSK